MMVKFESEVKWDFIYFFDEFKSACNEKGKMRGFVRSQRWCKKVQYGAKTNVTQVGGNFVTEVNLLEQPSTFHLIKAPLPASHSLASNYSGVVEAAVLQRLPSRPSGLELA